MTPAPDAHSPVPRGDPDRPARPDRGQIRRWRKYLAEERAEARIYSLLAARSTGREQEILHQVAEAEQRHAEHWVRLLGPHAEAETRPSLYSRLLIFLATHFGSVFVLALIQRAESRSPYERDEDASDAMAADEAVHEEIIRALATEGRHKLSGNFRAAVFGANDGLVSNLALVMGVGATGTSPGMVLFAGIAGLLAGALSMGAGEFVSVRSQRELLADGGGAVAPEMLAALASGDVERLSDLLLAEGMPDEEARPFAGALLRSWIEQEEQPADVVGSALGAALSSFSAFALGAFVPVVPYLLADGGRALAGAVVLTGIALFAAGTTASVLTGGPLLRGGLRQLAIGSLAAAVTYGLGRVLGVTIS